MHVTSSIWPVMGHKVAGVEMIAAYTLLVILCGDVQGVYGLTWS